jgi:hypothetical protein
MYQNKFQATKVQNLLERSEKIPQTPDASFLACCPIMSPSLSSLSLSPLPCCLRLLHTSLTPYEQLLIAEGSGAMAWSSWWWCWVLHSSSLLSLSSEDAPVIHPTSSCLWMCGGCWFIMPWGRSWGVISMRQQVKEGWGAYLPYMGL